MQPPATATVDRQRLIDALDTLADVTLAIEGDVDDRARLTDHDELISRLRGVIADLVFEMEANALLG